MAMAIQRNIDNESGVIISAKKASIIKRIAAWLWRKKSNNQQHGAVIGMKSEIINIWRIGGGISQ